MDLRQWLMAGTYAGYDDDAQISCEHGGEGGQNVSLVLSLSSKTNDKLPASAGGGLALAETQVFCSDDLVYYTVV